MPSASGLMSIWAMLAMFGIKGSVGKIRSEHQQRVAVHHRFVSGGEADQSCHSDVERIVVFKIFLSTEGMNNRRLELARQLDDVVMRAGTAGTAQQRHSGVGIEQRGKPL